MNHIEQPGRCLVLGRLGGGEDEAVVERRSGLNCAVPTQYRSGDPVSQQLVVDGGQGIEEQCVSGCQFPSA